VSSCASKDAPLTRLPPAADLALVVEPAYPVAALAEDESGEAAELGWHDDMLIWGRQGWAQVARVCRWAKDMGAPVDCAPR
jgi:hypothetical protein